MQSFLKELENQKFALDQHSIVVITDTKGKVIYANDKFCEISKYAKQELIGQNIKLINSGYHGSGFFAEMWDTITQGKVWKGDIKNKAKDGSFYWVQTTIVPFRGDDGEILQYVSVRTDITKLKDMESGLRAERDKLHGILAALGEGMLIVNREQVIEFQNQRFSEQFGTHEGCKLEEVFPSMSQEPLPGHVLAAIESGKPQRCEIPLNKDRWFELCSSPFKTSEGEAKVIELVRDITERKQFQAEALRAGHLASIGELAAGVAHEINNPINGIINYAQILLDHANPQSCLPDIPQRIIKEGDRIASIVKNLLDFARDRKEEHTPGYLQDIIDDSLGLTERQLAKDGISLVVRVPGSLPKTKCRSQQLQQVVLNLISNARYALNAKFPGHHPDKVLEIEARHLVEEELSWLQLVLFDRGIGIPAAILPRICEPFFSSKPRGEGTGLGLSISHGIIADHGGTLRFESREGEYTKVIISIPVKPA